MPTSPPATVPPSPCPVAAAAAACLLLPALALAQAASAPPPAASAPRAGSVVIRAQEIHGRPDLEAVAEGDAEFERGDVTIRADRLSYESADDLAQARGRVRITRQGDVYSGPELQLRLQRFEGFFLSPEYYFARTGAGGRADRIDFIDASRSLAINASYTSCPRDGSGDPDWLLSARRVKVDFESNEGVAEGAVLRFLGVPILAAPVLSFPLTDERKSGWLPPNVNLDSRSGFEFGVPYYWNIAPNRDATLTPRVLTRRGVGLDSEFRYLEQRHQGQVGVDLLPNDRVAGRSRHALRMSLDGWPAPSTDYAVRMERVSDDDWWKDFPRAIESLTPRLLPLQAQVERRFGGSAFDALFYARLQRWQVLQTSDTLVAPYERSPQLGVRVQGRLAAGVDYALESELNRFTLPDHHGGPGRPTGQRWHALGSIARPWRQPGWWVTPKLSLNAAAYDTEDPGAAARSGSRVIPTASVDAGLVFERSTQWFGRALQQTLEPRMLYVRTPLRDQSALPNFDAAAKDFNFASIYSENDFAGIDRVSDANQLTAGVTSRLLDRDSGAEALRVGIVQRYLFSDQQLTPLGAPIRQRFSDVLLLAASNLLPRWTLDAAVQYNPDISRTVRSIVGARYSPGPFRTVNATYRLARGLSEQIEWGWQWPLRREPAAPARAATPSSSCVGAWYSVGRVNFSLRDSRITDSLVGLEYDAGCWIGRVVAERLSTGRSEATTRLLLQLELVGLSRLGSNPLKVLKDNIPGYRPLREDPGTAPARPSP